MESEQDPLNFFILFVEIKGRLAENIEKKQLLKQ